MTPWMMLVRKELRDSLPWALIGGLLMTIGLAAAMMYESSGLHNHASRNFGIMSDFSQVSTNVVSVLVGLALGFITFFRDLRPGTWAFLVHRPMSRQRIFAAKVAAGLGLYFAATLVPFLAVAWWSSLDGSLAFPFHWRMMLPGLADISLGVLYWFAGAAVAIREARWYATRLFPLVVAIWAHAIGLIKGTWYPEFYQVMLIHSGGLLILLPTVYAAFLGRQTIARPRWWLQTATGLCVLPGILTVMLLSTYVVLALIFFSNDRFHSRYQVVQYLVLRDGRIVRHTISYDDRKERSSVYHDLQGQQLELSDDDVVLNERALLPSMAMFVPYHSSYYSDGSWRDIRRLFIGLYDDGPARHGSQDMHQRWFLDRGSQSLVGYDLRNRRLLGAMGPEGFVPGQRRAEPAFDPIFTSDLTNSFLTTPRHIYKVDYVAHTVRVIATSEPSDPFDRAVYPLVDNALNFKRGTFAVTTVRELQLIDDAGNIQFRTPILRPIHHMLYLGMFHRDNQTRYVLRYSYYRETTELISILDDQGQLLEKLELPATNRLLHTHLSEEDRQKEEMQNFRRYVVPMYLLPPPVWTAVTNYSSLYYVARNPDGGPPAPRSVVFAYFFYFTAGIVLQGLVGFLVMYRITSVDLRSPPPIPAKRWQWLLLAVGLGVWAVPLFYCLHPRPVREKCPQCGRRRAVDGVSCPHCAVAWPMPGNNGTELFA
ncbi:MAG: ABC transporter permease [Phycisphaerales bacterium]|nr:ABC transporter permease [Phycisphaerales bacterium]